jgi:hypothetical protein
MSNKNAAVLEKETSRREVIKKAVYMTPVILTLAAVPSFAAKGSYESKKPKEHKEKEHKEKEHKEKEHKEK